MAWRAELRPSAFKALSKLERADQETVRAALDGLLAELDARGRPVASDVKKLKGTKDDYRLRAGNYRVV